MHLQRVLGDIGQAFVLVDWAINSHFIPAILDSTNLVSNNLHTLLSLPVKLVSVGVPDPTSLSVHNHHAS